MDAAEWDTPLLSQEGVVPDGCGVALCSRKSFLAGVEWWARGSTLAIILPGGEEWFKKKEELSRTAVAKFNEGAEMQSTYLLTKK